VVRAGPPSGSAERELLRAGVRYSLRLRAVIVLVSSLLPTLVARPPQPVATALVVVGLNAWTAWYACRFPQRGRWLVPMDVAVLCTVCLTQVWTSPAAASASGVTWVVAVAGITVITYAWQLGLAAHAAATLVVMAAVLVGAAVADTPGWVDVVPVQLWMVIEAVLSRALYVLVRRGARAADAAVARGERARRDEAVTQARRDDEHEYLAALHDTASATLLMVGSGVADRRTPWLSEQAARDLATIGGDHTRPADEVDLSACLREVAAPLPLTVRWEMPSPLVVAGADAAALVGGVREALTNVVRHAGVGEAAVSAWREDNRVVVEVVDDGAGFDPGHSGEHRYGLTRSIVERMTRTGGHAEVTSSPGAGTRVRFERVPAEVEQGGEVETISTNVGQALAWAVVAMNLVILYGLDLPRLLANQGSYRPVWPQFLTLAVLTGVTLVVAAHLWRRRGLGSPRWVLAVVVFAVAVPATASVPPELRLGIAHWSEGDAAWTLVLVLLDSRFPVFACVLLAHYAMTFTQIALGGDAGVTLGAAVNATSIVLGYQLAVGMIAAVLRPVAATAAATTHRAERLRTERAIATRLHEDRRARYAALADTAAPLLARLASGEADPGDEAVRRACTVEAARIRRLLAEDATAPDPLVRELRACVELAERNGISVGFAVRGECPPVPTAGRRALADPVVAVLATAATTARVTVLGTGDAVTVSVVADAPHVVPFPRSEEDSVQVRVGCADDRVWVRTTWRRP
jgi:signal transduction histidine kinase